MATKRTANVYVRNNTGGTAAIQMTHQYSSAPPETGAWQATPGQVVGPLVVHYETGFGTGLDWWRINIQVKDGPNSGNYSSSRPKECMLRADDAGKDIVNTVDTRDFRINLPSGGCGIDMVRTSRYSPITHVFVLMLENHSFDVVLGNSKISGRDARTGKPTTIKGLTGNESNTYNGIAYKVQPFSRDPMVTDPGHEFDDTLEQLCGQGKTYQTGKPYPPINNSGFVANYATTKSEGPPSPPPPANYGDIMGAYNSGQPGVKVITWLASNYLVCDRWYSSIPGPTWPNRFFAMGASSEGVDFSPSPEQILGWEAPGGGFEYVNGSLFDLVRKNGMNWRVYGDVEDQFSPRHGSLFGSIPIATALKNITLLDVHSFSGFAKDLQDHYPYQFTWIEPNYGDATSTFQNGSSQHPMDSMPAGSEMLYAAYNAISKSPLWATSLFIVTYDEHGGYYDHEVPPSAVPPGDSDRYSKDSKDKFDFTRLGVRVPTVVISPRLPANSIDHAVYDHSSIAKTMERLFGWPSLTERDASANSLYELLTSDILRTDIGEAPALPHEAEIDLKSALVDESTLDLQPLPQRGNLNGFVMLAVKADMELSDGSAESKATITAKAATIKSRGDARRYIGEVVRKADASRKSLTKRAY